MNNMYKFIMLSFFIILLVSCNQVEDNYKKIEPAQVTAKEGSKLSDVYLTERAVERIGIETAEVTEESAGDDKQLVVPYSSILYDANGGTWVYTNPAPQHYLRQEIKIGHITEEKAFLFEGPSSGTTVVSQGAVELLGTEFHVGH